MLLQQRFVSSRSLSSAPCLSFIPETYNLMAACTYCQDGRLSCISENVTLAVPSNSGLGCFHEARQPPFMTES